MEFEEMSVIWNSQNEEPLYALNEKGLFTIIKNESRRFKRKMRWQELQSYAAALLTVGCVGFYLFIHYTGLLEDKAGARPFTYFDQVALLVAAACWRHFALAVFLSRRKQARREEVFNASLAEHLERELFQVDFQIGIRKRIAIRYVPPYLGAFLILTVTIRMIEVSPWFLLPVAAVLATALLIEARCQRRLVDREMIPRKRELESLRSKLREADRI